MKAMERLMPDVVGGVIDEGPKIPPTREVETETRFPRTWSFAPTEIDRSEPCTENQYSKNFSCLLG